MLSRLTLSQVLIWPQDLAKGWMTLEILVPLQTGEIFFSLFCPDSLWNPTVRLLGSYRGICAWDARSGTYGWPLIV
jgi:hypothetical protein